MGGCINWFVDGLIIVLAALASWWAYNTYIQPTTHWQHLDFLLFLVVCFLLYIVVRWIKG